MKGGLEQKVYEGPVNDLRSLRQRITQETRRTMYAQPLVLSLIGARLVSGLETFVYYLSLWRTLITTTAIQLLSPLNRTPPPTSLQSPCYRVHSQPPQKYPSSNRTKDKTHCQAFNNDESPINTQDGALPTNPEESTKRVNNSESEDSEKNLTSYKSSYAIRMSKQNVNNVCKHSHKGGRCEKYQCRYRKPCKVEGCSTPSKNRGLCYAHGGCNQIKCSVEDCSKQAHKRGVCHAHGSYIRKKCTVEDCSKQINTQDDAISHNSEESTKHLSKWHTEAAMPRK
uniref:WRKY19-like zinc finger domain-containing protein n=1 Tax=Timema shepardi TaxID=629360 RepID=A0A7R9G0H7_TIMSH|nr:unnamed protein product [Timema shepardi]